MLSKSTFQNSEFIQASSFLVGTLAMLFLAGSIAGAPNFPKGEVAVQARAVTQGQCEDALDALGVKYSTSGKVLSVKEPSKRDLASLVERSSLVMQSCPGAKLQDFCAGEGCLPDAGLSLELALSEE